MGTEFLFIILLWCGPLTSNSKATVSQCRTEKIKCVQNLTNFTTDDVIAKCLQK